MIIVPETIHQLSGRTIPALDEDRYLHPDLIAACDLLRDGSLVRAVEEAADRERLVANRLGVEAEAWPAGKKDVVGIAFEVVLGDRGVLAIDRAGEDLLQQAALVYNQFMSKMLWRRWIQLQGSRRSSPLILETCPNFSSTIVFPEIMPGVYSLVDWSLVALKHDTD